MSPREIIEQGISDEQLAQATDAHGQPVTLGRQLGGAYIITVERVAGADEKTLFTRKVMSRREWLLWHNHRKEWVAGLVEQALTAVEKAAKELGYK